MTERLVNYAFISYKRIEPDETWAKNLHRLLNSWYIPTDIAYNERLNNNKRISPIVRDKDNFPPGNGLDETIKTALRQSRSLILILSKAMIEDQMARRSKGEHAYIFEEIEYFQSLERSQRAIIPVYIDSDNQNPSELLPPMLKGYDKLILNVNDYFQTSKRQWAKRVAAAVAAGIFQKDQVLFWDYHRKAVRKSRIKIASIILLVFIFFVGLPLLLLLNQQRVRTRIAESYGLIEQSRQARKAHDTQAALIFAIEAYEKSPDLDAALSNLRQQAIPNEQEPRTFLAGGSTISSNGDELITYSDQTVRILNARDLSVIETIGSSFLTIWRMSFSPDSRIVGLLGGDSLWIYNRDMHKYIYAERHRHHLIGFYGSYKTLFSPVDNYYLQMLGDYIIRLNVETKHTDTLSIGGYINDVQQVEDNIFLGISDSTRMGVYHFDYKRLKLTPVFVAPRQTRGNWTFHAQSSQIAYEVNDSIYRESPRRKIFCGVGTIKSFESDGNRLLWQKKYPEDNSIVLTDSNGYRNVKRLFWNDDRLHTVYWGRNDENILLMYDDYIQIIESKYPYQERDKLILPRKHNYHISFLWSDSLFAITSPHTLQDEIGYISYDYLAHNVNLKRPIYTLDGQMCLYERDDIENEVVCTRTQDDSIVWHIAAYPAGSLTHKGWISPNRKRCALAHKLHYDEKYRVSRIVGIKIVDVSSGNVLFEKDSASFERFLSDDIFAYVNHDSVFIADVKTKHEFYWGRDESGLDEWLQRGCQCAEDNDRIYRITNLSGVQVYDFSTKNQLLNIPLSIDDISSISIASGISPSGELLFVNQLFREEDDDRHSFSKITIWDVINKKMLFEDTLDELYFGGLITDDGYLLLNAWDRIALYNVSSRKHIATMRFASRPLNIVQLNNTHVLINFPNEVVLEIDLKKGKIVEEKEYPDGIGDRILGGHYIMSGNSLIDLNTDKIVLQLNKNEDNNTHDYVISIQDSIMLIDRTIDNRESREMIIPFEDEEALVRRVLQIVGQRVLSPHERAQYRE